MMKHSVLCGVDRASDLQTLVGGKKTALLTAASGVTKGGIPTYTVLREMSDLRLLFAPEHGLASAMQDGSSPKIWMPQGRSASEISISSSLFLL